jgi:hypothetical protein
VASGLKSFLVNAKVIIMPILPRLRTVETVPQLMKYVDRHKGAVKGRLLYDIDETIGRAEAWTDTGSFVSSLGRGTVVDFLRNHVVLTAHGESTDGVHYVQHITPEDLARNSVVAQVRSRHDIAA